MHNAGLLHLKLGSCNLLGGVLASHTCFLCRGFWVLSLPDIIFPVTKLQIGTASAGNTHSLVHRTNPPTAGIVPQYRVA